MKWWHVAGIVIAGLYLASVFLGDFVGLLKSNALMLLGVCLILLFMLTRKGGK